MAAQQTQIDVLVLGGGPAGAATAGLLAQRGHVVWLVDDGREHPAAPVETLLPAALSAIDRCGLGDVVRGAATRDQRRHGAVWDQPELIWQQLAPTGLCLLRPAFEREMRRWAASLGAELMVGRAARMPGAAEEPIELTLSNGGPRSVRARIVVIATGRRRTSLIGTQVVAQAAETAAFALTGHAGGEHENAAIVEAAQHGWSWWIGAPGDRSVAVVCVDAQQLRDSGRRALVDQVLNEAQGPVARLCGHRITGAVRATSRLLCIPGNGAGTRPVLLVGDAAATLDPLASQGTEKALVGAETAAVALHTALAEPGLTAPALAFHARWERELWFAQQRTAAQFYSRVERFAKLPFWRARSAAENPPAPLPERLVARPDLEEVLVLQRRGPELVRERGFAAAGLAAISRVGHVRIEAIIASLRSPATVDDAIRRAGQHPELFALGPPLVRAAVEQLWQRGFLLAARASAN